MNINEYTIRRAKQEDAKSILHIRNNFLCRKKFNNRAPVSLKDHLKWFKKQYLNNENYCFVLVYNKRVIGYCRFDYDIDSDLYIISIAIDPDFHGKGLGDYLLKSSIDQKRWKKKLIAEIHKENIPSINLFKSNNFALFKKNKNNLFYKYDK